MIYPNHEWKKTWDGMITLVLLFTCMMTPYRIAFSDSDPLSWTIINLIIDSMFLIDMILSFLTAYYTEEFVLVDERSEIAKNYLTSWFLIDMLAIIPFSSIVSKGSEDGYNNAQVNDMIRIAKLGRLYKILRIMRLFRVLKIGK